MDKLHRLDLEFESPHMEAAIIATRQLKAAGFEAYVIGGAVRDLLLDKHPKDFDLATDARPEQILGIDGFEKAHYQDTAQAYGVTRIRIKAPNRAAKTTQEIELEIATYREDVEAHRGRKATKVRFADLEADIKRRDLTVNALALDIDSGELVDLVQGRSDIENKLIRFIGSGKTRVKEDPLRLLRAVRFKNLLGFEYEAKTEKAIVNAARKGLAGHIAIERLKSELTRMLMDKNRRACLEDLDRLGLLGGLLPEVAAGKGIEQPPNLHAEGDVFRHTMLSIDYLPDIVSPRLAWATLLHDIGKVPTFRSAKASGDRIRFDQHYRVGAEMAAGLLKRLGFNSRFRTDVSWMIHHHLSVDELPNMRERRADNFMHHPAFGDLLELHKADAHAAWGRDTTGRIDDGPADFSDLTLKWDDYQRRRKKHAPSLKHDLGIDGNWLISVFKLEPGPELARLLDALEEAYLNHELHTASEAKTHVKELLDRKDSE